MKTLINLLDHYFSLANNAPDHKTRKCFYDQAFGAVQYHSFLLPDQHRELEALWNDTYKPRFEYLLYEKDWE